jgi:hypothetical protein
MREISEMTDNLDIIFLFVDKNVANLLYPTYTYPASAINSRITLIEFGFIKNVIMGPDLRCLGGYRYLSINPISRGI